MNGLIRALRTCAPGLMLIAVSAFGQTPEPPSVELFFSKPDIAQAVISPTGRRLALASRNKEGHEQLVVFDTEKLGAVVAASFTNGDVTNIHWLSDKRLLYSAADPDREAAAIYVPQGLYAVDADGSDYRNLLSLPQGNGGRQIGASVFQLYTRFLATTWQQDSDDVFVTEPKFNRGELEYVKLLKMNTRTGRVVTWTPPGDPLSWFIGPGDRPHYVITREEGSRASILYSDGPGSNWKKVGSFERFGMDGFRPLGYGADGTTYIAERRGESDYAAVYTFDPKTHKSSDQPIVSAKGFDLAPVMLRSGDRIVGVRYLVDAEATHWFDPDMKKMQEKIDALLPGTVNRIDAPLRPEVPMVLVTAYSDTEPGQFYLYNRETGKVVHIGHRKAVDPARMARRDLVRIKARDGLEIPVWVTTPPGGKQGPRPAVVLVHGGPWIRGGLWAWNPEAEFLASRGYLVIEPEFRGSVGYGKRLFRSGWKQWGLAMQNDVADAARWAIGKGMADAKRVCIGGASYGGYATLMGLVNDPDLYRCGFEWIGVTDIDLMYSATWSDISDEYKAYGMPTLIGDPDKDATQLKATSPLQQATRIRSPLLLGYGAQDRRVPIQHGTRFRDEVAKTNHDVEWVVYPDEGHGWAQLKDNVDWWTRVEKFLARNIGDH